MNDQTKKFSELLESLQSDDYQKELKLFQSEKEKRVKESWDSLDYDLKLDILYYLGKVLVEHAKEGGS